MDASFSHIQEYIDHPLKFKELELEEQLSIIADITLFYSLKKVEALKAAKKTRVDQCVEAREWEMYEKYWEGQNMNIKKLADLEMSKLRKGL